MKSFINENFEGFIRNIRWYDFSSNDLFEIINSLIGDILDQIELFREQHHTFQFQILMECEYRKEDKCIRAFHNEKFVYYKDVNWEVFFDELILSLIDRIDNFETKGSGWRFSNINSIQLKLVRCNPLKKEIGVYIPTPKFCYVNNKQIPLRNKVVNVKNNDDRCFGYSVISACYPATKKVCRASIYEKFWNRLNWSNVHFPADLKDIEIFENNNKIGVNIYRFKTTSKIIETVRTTYKYTKNIDLLLLEEQSNYHFCYLKDVSCVETIKLPSEIINKRAVLNNSSPKHYSFNACMQHYDIVCDIPYPESKRVLQKFAIEKEINLNIFKYKDKEIYPLINCEGNKIIDLLLYKKKFFVIKHLSRLLRSEISKHKTQIFICRKCLSHFPSEERLNFHTSHLCQQSGIIAFPPYDTIKFTRIQTTYQHPVVIYADFECLIRNSEHIPIAFGMLVKFRDNQYTDQYISYSGENLNDVFLDKLKDALKFYEEITKKPMETLTPLEQAAFDQATECSLCGETFNKNKTHHHDHYTGRFITALCNVCNLKIKIPNFLPVIIHYLSGYDSHLFLRNLIRKAERIDVVARSKERFYSIKAKLKNFHTHLRFLDSHNFLPSSLDSLVSNLNTFHTLSDHFEYPDLVKRKGIFCYEYLDCIEKLNETCLPPITAFHNKLNEYEITEEEYAHAQKVWDTYQIKTLHEYLLLYLRSDVVLLSEVYETFRNMCLTYYSIDPVYSISLSQVSWDACLKYTRCEIHLLKDTEMVQMIERGIRGGVCDVALRYCEANNASMKEFNPLKPNVYLKYFDANSLYATCMTHPLPVSDFKWEWYDIDEAIQRMKNLPSGHGMILSVDLTYPSHLHQPHKDLPLAPMREGTKLISSFHDKNDYVVYYKTLLFYIDQGLTITKIHRIITFREEACFKPYMEFNVQKRQLAQTKVEKDFFKLLNNSIFGKSIQNPRNMKNITIHKTWNSLHKSICKPFLTDVMEIAHDIAICSHDKQKHIFKYPMIIGFTILDLAKLFMYNFHYNVMKKKYCERIQLLYTDTDSYLYAIHTNNFENDLRSDPVFLDHFDICLDGRVLHKGVLGKMKDEYPAETITKFVGLRPKMYAIKAEGGDEIKRLKGVKKCVIKNRITFEDFHECLFKHIPMYVDQLFIESKKHNIYTVTQRKKALCHLDDKRKILPDGINTIPWGTK